MMSLTQIQADAMEAGVKAAKEKRIPFFPWPQDRVEMPLPFPVLGQYVPEGYELVDELFCDSSGFGADDEPALSQDQFMERFEELRRQGYGFGITTIGQFQLYVGVYKAIGESN